MSLLRNEDGRVENNNNRLLVLKLLKARNVKERSFEENIKYGNNLLEKLDYLQKANAHKNFQAFVSEQNIPSGSDHMKFGDSAQKTNYENLQRSLAESHAKISSLAEQVINLKDVLDEKNLLLTKVNSELEKYQHELKINLELCKSLKLELTCTKNALQNKSDEHAVLNISHSCIESRKNDLEIENKKLHLQALKHKEEREIFLRTETQKNYLEAENEKLQAEVAMLRDAKENFLSIENQKCDLEIENKKLVTQIAMLREARENSLRSGSYESVSSVDSNSSKNARRSSKKESVCSSHSTSKARSEHPRAAFPDKRNISFTAHDSEVNAVMWCPNPSYLVTAGSDRRLKLWKVFDNQAKLERSARDCNSSILSVDIQGGAESVLCASSDFSSRLWCIKDFKLGHTLTGHSGKVMSAKFVNESDTIISGSLDKTLKLWGKSKTLCMQTFNAQSPVNDVVSRDSSSVISGHWDRKIRLWDIRAKHSTNSIDVTGAVTSLDVSNHSSMLLAAVQVGKLKIFDMRTLKELESLSGVNFEIKCNWTRAKFSPSGKYCCCGSENGSAFIWNTETGALETELKGHESSVISCSWSVCGSYLATCDSNRKCIIWSK